MLRQKVYILFVLLLANAFAKSQSVNLSQPYISTQLFGPAAVGDGLYKQRVQSDLKTQIIDGSNLYNTAVVAWDRSITNLDPEQNNYLGVGAQLVSDRLMNGLVQNNTLGINLAYHIFLDKNLYNNISIGLGGIFSQTTLDKSTVKFADQYYGTGVETGSGSMENLKSFPSSASMNTGILFTRHAESTLLKAGVSLFFFDKPQVTNSNLNESGGIRKMIFFQGENKIFYDYTILLHGYISEQNNIRKYVGGGAISFPITSNWEEVKRMYIGCTYKRGESLSPTISFLMNYYILGVSYDINDSKLAGSQIKQTSFEITFSRSFGKRKSQQFRSLLD